MLAVLLGCKLRRSKLIDLTSDHIQRREDHWAIVDLVGKAAHIRTVPMPDWVKEALDNWLGAADRREGKLFRCVSEWDSVGQRSHRKSYLAHREGVGGATRHITASPPLPEEGSPKK